MNLILSKTEYLNKKPVYGLELPEYLSQVLGMSTDEYFTAGMLQTQRFINAYLKNFLQKANWDVSIFDAKTQETIKEILFLEFQFLHENQIWFSKVNDVQYSTAGQQTFTFNSSVDYKEELIPDVVKKMISNSGLLVYATNFLEEASRVVNQDNRFRDGYLVPNVDWNSKCNNIINFNGGTSTVESAISSVKNNSVQTDNPNYRHAITITSHLTENGERLQSQDKILSSQNFYQNKQNNDYAQIKDVRDTWDGANSRIALNSQKIQQNQDSINNLTTTKLNISDANNTFNTKANLDLKNVQMDHRAAPQFLKVNEEGQLTFANAATDLIPVRWNPDTLFTEGDAVYFNLNNNYKIYIATDAPNNRNQQPSNNLNYWVPYEFSINLENFYTKNQTDTKFLNKENGGTMSADIDMANNRITNVANLVSTDNVNQDIEGDKKFLGQVKIEHNNDALNLNATGNNGIYANFLKANDRKGHIGLNENSNDLTINSVENIVLNPANNKLIIANKKISAHSGVEFGNNLTGGFGGNEFKIIPDGGTKALKFGDNNVRFNLDLEGRSDLSGIKTPTNPTDAVNKQYVDTKFAEGGGNVNLDNYYTKPETNTLLDAKVNTTELSNYARKDQNNTFTGNIISTSNNNNFCSRNDGISLLKIQRGNGDDLLWVGKQDAGSNQVYISSKAEHMTIEAANNKVLRLTGPAFITSDSTLRFETPTNKYAQFGTDIRFGFGSTNIKFSSDDGNNKKISFGGNGGRGKLDIDLENNAKIINVPNPVADKDATNKSYVDNKFNSIPAPDTSNLAKLEGNNHFIGENLFSGSVRVPTYQNGDIADTAVNVTYLNQRFNNVSMPSQNSQIANKEYVDRQKVNMLLLTCKTKQTQYISPMSTGGFSGSEYFTISSTILSGHWNVVNIMYGGGADNPNYTNSYNPMVVSLISTPFSGYTDIIFNLFNLSKNNAFNDKVLLYIVLVKNVDAQDTTRPSRSIEDMKRALNEDLDQFEVIEIKEL